MSAFWELYLHESFLRQGFVVEMDIPVVGSARTLDFRLTRGASSLIVEATVLGASGKDLVTDARFAELLAYISKISTRHWTLGVSANAIGPSQFSKREFRDELTAWLTNLDVNEETLAGDDFPRRFPWTVDGWDISIGAIRRGAAAIAKQPSAPISIRMGPGGFCGGAGRLARRLSEKAGAYGDVGFPFVIAVLLDEAEFIDGDAPPHALYGITDNGDRGNWRAIDEDARRESRPLWGAGCSTSSGRVSAVLLTGPELHPHSVSRQLPVLWQNPAPTRPLTDEFDFASGRLISSPLGVSIAHAPPQRIPSQLFELPPSWPGDPWPR